MPRRYPPLLSPPPAPPLARQSLDSVPPCYEAHVCPYTGDSGVVNARAGDAATTPTQPHPLARPSSNSVPPCYEAHVCPHTGDSRAANAPRAGGATPLLSPPPPPPPVGAPVLEFCFAFVASPTPSERKACCLKRLLPAWLVDSLIGGCGLCLSGWEKNSTRKKRYRFETTCSKRKLLTAQLTSCPSCEDNTTNNDPPAQWLPEERYGFPLPKKACVR